VPLTIYRSNGLPKAAQPGVVPLVTGLPTIPSDGQEICYQADAANGVVWRLRYNAASASPYKWEVVGGSALAAFVATSQVTSTAYPTFVDLATVGPQIIVPLAGEYHAEGSHISYTAAASSSYARLMVNGVWVRPCRSRLRLAQQRAPATSPRASRLCAWLAQLPRCSIRPLPVSRRLTSTARCAYDR
jgi:hypothetical protein